MAVRGKRVRKVKSYKSKCKNKNAIKHRKSRTYKRPRCMRGGNYNTTTTRTTMGEATRELNKITVTKPGYPVMSGSTFFKLEDNLDTNGDDEYR
jgi:hypothetical protein